MFFISTISEQFLGTKLSIVFEAKKQSIHRKHIFNLAESINTSLPRSHSSVSSAQCERREEKFH